MTLLQSELEELSVDQKCHHLFKLLKDSFKKQEELEERTQFLEKIISSTYPSPEELKRFLEVSPVAWRKLLTQNDNWHNNWYNLEFLEWIYYRSKNRWADEKFPTAKQVNYALRLLDEHERRERRKGFNPGNILKRIKYFFRKE